MEIANRKIRQPKSQSNISSKRKAQVKKLLACKITCAMWSNKLIKKQPTEVFCKKKVYFKFSRCAHRKTPVYESLLNKVVGLKPINFIKTRLRPIHAFSCEYCNFFKKNSFKNIFEQLFLIISSTSWWKSISDKCLCLLFFKRSIWKKYVYCEILNKMYVLLFGYYCAIISL